MASFSCPTLMIYYHRLFENLDFLQTPHRCRIRGVNQSIWMTGICAFSSLPPRSAKGRNPPILGMSPSWVPKARCPARPDCLPARPCRSTACPLAGALATVLKASLTGFDRSSKPAPAAARRRDSSTNARRSSGSRSLRQGRRGDTVEAIAPDAATLRSRHVARRLIPRLVLDVAYGLLIGTVVEAGRA
jgi:hypothetical protein